MPKLDLTSAHEFWKNYDDPMIYRVISFMETAEDFTMDGNPAWKNMANSAALMTLAVELGKEDQFITYSHIKTSRILRLPVPLIPLIRVLHQNY